MMKCKRSFEYHPPKPENKSDLTLEDAFNLVDSLLTEVQQGYQREDQYKMSLEQCREYLELHPSGADCDPERYVQLLCDLNEVLK